MAEHQQGRSLAERIRAANADVWDAMQAHRFVAEIEADRLPTDVLKAYLVYECDFVETAMLIFGHMLVKAPGLAERRWLAGVLQALAVEQIGYFERTFDTLGITAADRARSLPRAVLDFRDGMLAIARDGPYRDGVTAMLAAEWLYATFCTRAAACAISDPILKRWVDLHAEPAFLDQAEWLRREIDKADPTEEPRLSAVFRRAITLEIAFHQAPFESRSHDR